MNIYQIAYTGVFLVGGYESVISLHKFKMADPIWQPKISKIIQFLWKSICRGFLGRWLRIRYKFLQIQDDGSNMAVKNFKNCSITILLYTQFGNHSS